MGCVECYPVEFKLCMIVAHMDDLIMKQMHEVTLTHILAHFQSHKWVWEDNESCISWFECELTVCLLFLYLFVSTAWSIIICYVVQLLSIYAFWGMNLYVYSYTQWLYFLVRLFICLSVSVNLVANVVNLKWKNWLSFALNFKTAVLWTHRICLFSGWELSYLFLKHTRG